MRRPAIRSLRKVSESPLAVASSAAEHAARGNLAFGATLRIAHALPYCCANVGPREL